MCHQQLHMNGISLKSQGFLGQMRNYADKHVGYNFCALNSLTLLIYCIVNMHSPAHV